MRAFRVAELAREVAGAVEGDPDREITGVAPIAEAGPGDLTFVHEERYRQALERAAPGAVLVPREMPTPPGDFALIRVDDPQLAFIRLVTLFHPPAEEETGVHRTASIGAGARLGDSVSIGPGALIGDEASIGAHTRIGPYTVVGRSVRIGASCRIAHGCSVLEGARLGDRVRLHPGVRIATDGFGYARTSEGAVKVPQVGGCAIGDDVEIGANSTIDRGSLGDTVVGRRTKIDNLVHIGHNVEIGEDCMIVAQVGIAGSVRIGAGAALAGQAGIAGHLEIGPGARIAAQAGVIGDVPAGATYSGYPARPHGEAMRASAALFRLPDALRRLERVERQLGLEPQAEGSDEAE